MPSHLLLPECATPLGERWFLEWDARKDGRITLTDPSGQVWLDAEARTAHRLLELRTFYRDRRIVILTPRGGVPLKPNPKAAADLRALVEPLLGADRECCRSEKRTAFREGRLGLLVFLGCAVPFAGYCVWAGVAPNPPKGHWLYAVGPLIHLVLLLLMGFGLAGLVILSKGIAHFARVRRIERDARAGLTPFQA